MPNLVGLRNRKQFVSEQASKSYNKQVRRSEERNRNRFKNPHKEEGHSSLSLILFSVVNYLKIQNLTFLFYVQKTFQSFQTCIDIIIIHNLKQIYQKSIIVKQIFIGQRVSIQQINPTRLGS